MRVFLFIDEWFFLPVAVEQVGRTGGLLPQQLHPRLYLPLRVIRFLLLSFPLALVVLHVIPIAVFLFFHLLSQLSEQLLGCDAHLLGCPQYLRVHIIQVYVLVIIFLLVIILLFLLLVHRWGRRLLGVTLLLLLWWLLLMGLLLSIGLHLMLLLLLLLLLLLGQELFVHLDILFIEFPILVVVFLLQLVVTILSLLDWVHAIILLFFVFFQLE